MRTIKRIMAFVVVGLLISSPSYAQEWAVAYGGSTYDWGESIQQTTDGGYIVAGETRSFGAGSYDVWVLKLDPDGTVAWQKTYGLSGLDQGWDIQQTTDGGYIVAGYTSSLGAGLSDFWILKLNSDGTVAWQKTYGGSNYEWAFSIQETTDGGYIVAGDTSSFGAGYVDIWLLKLNSDGTVAWQKTYGGSGDEDAYSIQETTDGGYIVAGYTNSFGAGASDFWLLKLNSDGTISWQKTYGGSDHEYGHSIQQTSDGGYIVAGYISMYASICLVLKLNSDGSIAWQKTYGGNDFDYVCSIQQTSDGGYILVGHTVSFGAGDYDVWVVKLNSNGEIPGCSIIGTSNATVTNASASVQNTSITPQNTSVTPSDTSINPQDTSANISIVCPKGNQEVVYDGYLDKTQDGILADTMIVVSNTNKVGKDIQAWIEVSDKYGNLESLGKFYNGGQEISTVPATGFGWITLGMLVNRQTSDPFGLPGGEKFVIKISTDKGGQYNCGPAIVEIKQVTYKTRQEDPGEAIWNAANIATWAETALGGKLSSGIVWYPINVWP